jgi:hypothetical protein
LISSIMRRIGFLHGLRMTFATVFSAGIPSEDVAKTDDTRRHWNANQSP